MSRYPLNLALRLLLELALLVALGIGGWSQSVEIPRGLLAVLAPLAGAALWALFRVPGDGGDPVVAVPGPVRLLLESVLFAVGVAALLSAGRPRWAAALALIALVHYAISYDRVVRLLRG